MSVFSYFSNWWYGSSEEKELPKVQAEETQPPAEIQVPEPFQPFPDPIKVDSPLLVNALLEPTHVVSSDPEQPLKTDLKVEVQQREIETSTPAPPKKPTTKQPAKRLKPKPRSKSTGPSLPPPPKTRPVGDL